MAGENDDEKGKKQIFNTKYFIEQDNLPKDKFFCNTIWVSFFAISRKPCLKQRVIDVFEIWLVRES